MLGIIGGSGVYDLPGLNIIAEESVETPFGAPSAAFTIGTYGEGGGKIVFLARHGKSHDFLPHEVNYRANIWALKKLGVTRVIGISAVGSLRHELKPGDLCISDQYFDFVKGARDKSFFGGGMAAHVSTAEPTCPQLTGALGDAAEALDIPLHTGVTYGCVDGPRLGTRAESFFLKNAAGCDLVGMTNVPEAFLAREAQICYCTISVVTDYDCWLDDPAQHVSVEQVISRYGASLEKAKRLLGGFLARDLAAPDCGCRKSLETAVLSPRDSLSDDNKALLDILSR
ncbi:5'-methylthioadenosine phosphorylase [hydrothermal vent metagenome]|uniref:5'-methylthioadenosine phosphorylase n=1 Tax=hydrothermal vent metagenome TaxID=652676 RepID=A0A3B0S1J5_9ZZZZ